MSSIPDLTHELDQDSTEQDDPEFDVTVTMEFCYVKVGQHSYKPAMVAKINGRAKLCQFEDGTEEWADESSTTHSIPPLPGQALKCLAF